MHDLYSSFQSSFITSGTTKSFFVSTLVDVEILQNRYEKSRILDIFDVFWQINTRIAHKTSVKIP